MFDMIPAFAKDRRGNFGMLAGICIVPMLMAAGLGVDFTNAYSAKTKLDSAADAAVLAALSEAGQDMKVNGAKKVFTFEELLGGQFLKANIESEYGVDLKEFEVKLVNTNGRIEATATYIAGVETTMMRVFNKDEVAVSNTVRAAAQIDQKMSFYMLLDNTPSMGLAATPAEVRIMEQNTGCAFACHATQNADHNTNFVVAEQLGVSLRIDVVRHATEQIMDEMARKQSYAGQFKAGVYTFGEKAEDMGLTEIAAPSSSFGLTKDLVEKNVELMTIPYQNYNSDQQTDFDTTLKDLRKTIRDDEKAGDDSEKVVFLITDGVGDARKPVGCTRRGVDGGARCIEPVDLKGCEKLKKQGVKLAVLYTTYLPLPNNDFYNNWVSPFQPNIPAVMASCASPGLFAEVQLGESIPQALKELFNQATAAPRLIY